MYFYGEQRVLNRRNQFTNPSARLYNKLKNEEAKGSGVRALLLLQRPQVGYIFGFLRELMVSGPKGELVLLLLLCAWT